MCGLVGIFTRRSMQSIDESLLIRMNASLQSRGPDGSGSCLKPGLGMAHQRLSIIDLAKGHQPMLSQDKSLVLVFNGEIYNYRQLQKELEGEGCVFKTHSDSEVVLQAYATWGEACVSRFRGMFSFALYNENTQTLFLARDRVGVKPLYYALLPSETFIFASELKALMLHPESKNDFSQQAIADYFSFGYIPDPKTIYENIYKLEPGYTMRIERKGALTTTQYWDVPQAQTLITREEEAIEAIRSKIRDSVALRMHADVPVGAFLSGGVDSSIVVANMVELSTDNPVTTCTIGFEDPLYNEAHFAQEIADYLKTIHHQHIISNEPLPSTTSLSSIYDEPFADSSCLPTLQVCEMARKYVKVALAGDGGDELFAGYRRYRNFLLEQRLREKMPQPIRKFLFKPLAKWYPSLSFAPRFIRAKSTFEALSLSTVEGYFHSISLIKEPVREQLFSKQFLMNLDGYHPISVFERHVERAPKSHSLKLIQYLDFKTYLPGDILTKVDRASMYHGLEVREPLLDHELIELVQTIDPSLLIHEGSGKHLLKKAYQESFPPHFLERKKQGFSVPMRQWLEGVWRDKALRLINSEALRQTGIFNQEYIEKIVQEHLDSKQDHGTLIWCLYMFNEFIEHCWEEKQEVEDARIACA